MALVLHTSNDLERLGDLVLKLVKEDLQTAGPQGIFSEVMLVVPTVGLRDWLRQRLAQGMGICAGIRFCYPGQLATWLGTQLEAEGQDPNWADRALWHCLRALPDIKALQTYLGEEREAPGARSHGLAMALVDCLDRYAHYRPEWLSAWEMGKSGPYDHEAPWQPELWRRLLAEGCQNPVTTHRNLMDRISDHGEVLPDRLHAFGFNSLDPRFLETLTRLGQVSEVRMYSLQPTWGDWSDQRSRLRLLHDGENPDDGDSNRLLGDWGAIGKAFLQQVDVADAQYIGDPEDFRQPGTKQLLQRLQQDVVDAAPTWERGTHDLNIDDQSLQVHACHDLRRQLEVVKESLLTAFHRDPDLQPHDCAIMTPDPQGSGALAAAILEGEGLGPSLPVVVADRSQGSLNPATETLLKILDLLPSRFSAGTVMNFLGLSSVAHAWGFGADELGIIQEWIDGADLRWGIDADHRQEATGHSYSAGSWRRGLQRLQLAWWYGEDTEDAQPFCDPDSDPADAVLPLKNFEPGQFETLKRLSLLLQPIMDRANQARNGASISWWRQELTGLVQHVLRAKDDDPDVALVAGHLGTWSEQVTASGWDTALSGDLVSAHLATVFDRPAGGDFARGAITVCGLQPMRSIPFKLLFLVGMDDGAFPRQGRSLDVDLLRQDPQPGDRDVRREDRYLLLELLLSVRNQLIVTYNGFEPRDNTDLPPAGMIGELLDVAGATCGLDDRATQARLLTTHRLHRSLEGPTWPSAMVVDEYQSLIGERRTPGFAKPKVTTSPLPALEARDLIGFWRNPARTYLRSLGVSLPSFDEAPRDHERFAPAAGLDRYSAAMQLLNLARGQGGIDNEQGLRHRLAAEGWLPPGALGHHAWRELKDFVGHLREQKLELLEGCRSKDFRWHFANKRHISTTIPLYHDALGTVMIHPGGLSPSKLMELWVTTLISATGGGHQHGTLLYLNKGVVKEVSVRCSQGPEDHLATLIDGLDRGSGELLPFAIKLSEHYARQRWIKDKSHPKALQSALAAQWYASSFSPIPGESQTPEYQLVWTDPDGPSKEDDFITLAKDIWLPVLKASSEGDA